MRRREVPSGTVGEAGPGNGLTAKIGGVNGLTRSADYDDDSRTWVSPASRGRGTCIRVGDWIGGVGKRSCEEEDEDEEERSGQFYDQA